MVTFNPASTMLNPYAAKPQVRALRLGATPQESVETHVATYLDQISKLGDSNSSVSNAAQALAQTFDFYNRETLVGLGENQKQPLVDAMESVLNHIKTYQLSLSTSPDTAPTNPKIFQTANEGIRKALTSLMKNSAYTSEANFGKLSPWREKIKNFGKHPLEPKIVPIREAATKVIWELRTEAALKIK
jgi:hypothetical protein